MINCSLNISQLNQFEDHIANIYIVCFLKTGSQCSHVSRFSMISLEDDHSCQYDYVEVRDGDSLKSPVIGRYCGDESPPPIRSSGNSLHILFVSDGYNNYDGFFATFEEVSGTKYIASCTLYLFVYIEYILFAVQSFIIICLTDAESYSSFAKCRHIFSLISLRLFIFSEWVSHLKRDSFKSHLSKNAMV